MAIVVDANVALAWVLDDEPENHLYAFEVAKAAHEGRDELIAPSVLLGELMYNLLKKGRASRWVS